MEFQFVAELGNENEMCCILQDTARECAAIPHAVNGADT